jgi:chaperonin GroES
MASAALAIPDYAQEPPHALLTLAKIAKSVGDISSTLDDQTITTIGADAFREYKIDCDDRAEWEKQTRENFRRAAQEETELKDPPPYRHSNVNFPILTVASFQFNARAYPAICKPDGMVKIKVIGSDRGRPEIGPDGKPVMQPDPSALPPEQVSPATPGQPPAAPQAPQPPAMIPVWQIPPGAKQARADRVSSYMDVYIPYRLDDWEGDTDLLLTQLPIAGCGFRKVWWRDKSQRARYIPALDLVVPQSTRCLAETPRITEIMRDVYPYQIAQRMASGFYRTVTLTPEGEDPQEPRTLLEQHRLADLDGDGLPEPYVVTLDEKTEQVLRIEADFSEDDVVLNDAQDGVSEIKRRKHYIKYPFLRDPKGGFYDIGFGHLGRQLTDVIDVAINQMLDAGHAQIAGGGFLAAGLRLQGNARGDVLRWSPGEYKSVSASGQDLRAGIVERTFPNPSPIMYQLLELMLGAAKDITAIKDILVGDAPNNAPVGTTLALIEQGLQMFTAIYKRIYLALGEEFALMYENIGKYGGEAAAADYDAILDDPEANFQQDFAERDQDIKPVADPTAVTSAQRIAKAQVLSGLKGQGLNDVEINRRILEAANIDHIDALMPSANTPPDPMILAKLRLTNAQADYNSAHAESLRAGAVQKAVDVGHKLGESDGGGAANVAIPSGDALGGGGLGGPGGGAEGGMGAGVVAPGGF